MKQDLPQGSIAAKCVDLTYEGLGVCKEGGNVIFIKPPPSLSEQPSNP